MKRFIIENKGVITVILTTITVAAPFYYNKSEKDAQILYNKKRIDFYDEYAKESAETREEVVANVAVLTNQIKEQKKDIAEIKDGIDKLIEYNVEQQKMIQKFYHLNPNIKNPRYYQPTAQLITEENAN